MFRRVLKKLFRNPAAHVVVTRKFLGCGYEQVGYVACVRVFGVVVWHAILKDKEPTNDALIAACKVMFGSHWTFAEVETMREALKAAYKKQ